LNLAAKNVNKILYKEKQNEYMWVKWYYVVQYIEISIQTFPSISPNSVLY